MSARKSHLPLGRLFYFSPAQRPTPDFVQDLALDQRWQSVLAHPEAYRLLDQLWRKDPYTYEHCHRVAQYSEWIARELGMSPQERVETYLSGLLHDIGKVMTPDPILKKPGPLTPEEFSVIRLHPVDSGKLVAQTKDLGYLVPGIRSHHERIDGKGYPDALRGDQIDFISRMILVADTFDAMTTTRVYRKGLDLTRTYDELQRCSGTQFDPACVKAFLSAHQKFAADNPAAPLLLPTLDEATAKRTQKKAA